MTKYRWEMVVIVEAEDDIDAQSQVEEALEEAFNDPDGPFSRGEMTKVE